MSDKKLNDPYSNREAEKYQNPIPSREFILDLLNQNDRPLTQRNISKLLGLTSDDEIEALRRRLRAMERDGQLLRNRKNAYGVLSKMNLITGRVTGHQDGYGFLIPDEAGEDLFLNQREMQVALHGDRVVARVTGIDRRGRKEGAIVEIIKHANEQIVGRLFVDAGIYYLIPNNRRISQDILIPAESLIGAKEGQIVEIEITAHPSRHRSPLGGTARRARHQWAGDRGMHSGRASLRT